MDPPSDTPAPSSGNPWPEGGALSSRDGVVRPLAVPAEAGAAFILTLARALHSYGASAHRLEAMLVLVARRLGLEARFYSTPTAVLASFGRGADERTSLVRVEPGELNLEKLSLLQDAAVRVIRGELDVDKGRVSVARIVAQKPRFGAVATTACFGISSASAAVFFGGGPPEIAVSGVVGLGVGLIAGAWGRMAGGATLLEPIAASFAAVAAALAARAIPLAPLVVTLAGIVTLLPGLAITTAMTELSTRNLASGTARFAGASVSLLGLGFGVALGSRIVGALPAAPGAPVLAGEPPPALVVGAVVVASLAFAVLLQARPRDVGWIVLAGALAFAGARAGAALLGPELGALLGALLVGVGANLFARVFDRPSATMLVPGLLVLVPGSVGLRGVFSLLEQDVVTGVAAAFRMVLVAMAIVAGILFANVALPARRAL